MFVPYVFKEKMPKIVVNENQEKTALNFGVFKGGKLQEFGISLCTHYYIQTHNLQLEYSK